MEICDNGGGSLHQNRKIGKKILLCVGINIGRFFQDIFSINKRVLQRQRSEAESHDTFRQLSPKGGLIKKLSGIFVAVYYTSR